MWAVVRDDLAEAYGPFTSRAHAGEVALAMSNDVNPGYNYEVMELYPVRTAQREIRLDREQSA